MSHFSITLDVSNYVNDDEYDTKHLCIDVQKYRHLDYTKQFLKIMDNDTSNFILHINKPNMLHIFYTLSALVNEKNDDIIVHFLPDCITFYHYDTDENSSVIFDIEGESMHYLTENAYFIKISAFIEILISAYGVPYNFAKIKNDNNYLSISFVNDDIDVLKCVLACQITEPPDLNPYKNRLYTTINYTQYKYIMSGDINKNIKLELTSPYSVVFIKNGNSTSTYWKKIRKFHKLSTPISFQPKTTLSSVFDLYPNIINNIHLFVSHIYVTIKVEHDYGNMYILFKYGK